MFDRQYPSGNSLMKVRYDEYLKSDEWARKRMLARRRARQRCQVCNEGQLSLHVHHRTYENIYRERNEDLIVLCVRCHALFHDRMPKLTVEDQQVEFMRLYAIHGESMFTPEEQARREECDAIMRMLET